MKTNNTIHNIIKEKKKAYGLQPNTPSLEGKIELFYLNSLIKFSKFRKFIFQSRVFIGMCINHKKKGLYSTITLRNVIKKKAIKLKVYYYSPLVIEAKSLI